MNPLVDHAVVLRERARQAAAAAQNVHGQVRFLHMHAFGERLPLHHRYEQVNEATNSPEENHTEAVDDAPLLPLVFGVVLI